VGSASLHPSYLRGKRRAEEKKKGGKRIGLAEKKIRIWEAVMPETHVPGAGKRKLWTRSFRTRGGKKKKKVSAGLPKHL